MKKQTLLLSKDDPSFQYYQKEKPTYEKNSYWYIRKNKMNLSINIPSKSTLSEGTSINGKKSDIVQEITLLNPFN